MAFTNLSDFVSWLAERQADATALVCGDDSLTFEQLDEYSRSLALWFSRELGLQPHSRVVVRLPNDLHLPVTLFAAIRAGLVPVLVSSNSSAQEVERVIRETGAKATISVPQQAEHLAFFNAFEQPPKIIFSGRLDFGNLLERRLGQAMRPFKMRVGDHPVRWLSEGLEYGRSIFHAWPNTQSSDLALIEYTSGTTAAPKGVMLSHANLVANMMQLSECMSRAGSSRQERMLISLPLYFSYPLMLMLTNWMRGGAVALVTNIRDSALIAEQFDRFVPEVFVGISPVFMALCQDPLFPQLSFKELQYTICGGATLNERAAQRWREITRSPIAQGYGLTEASPVITFDIEMRGVAGYLGKPLYQTQIRIVDDAGEVLPTGAKGEIQVQGAQVMRGYVGQSERGLFPFTPDGWLRTADIGRLHSDGELELIERQAEVIRVPGFRVYPSEVETIVSKHPSVLECAVVGLPNEDGTQRIKLFVVTNDRRLTQRQVREYCRQRLTRYKVPDLVEFRNSLPHSASGRLQRARLVQESLPEPSLTKALADEDSG